MTVREIITAHLREIGADGLCSRDAECGCGIEDLILCQEDSQYCEPARRVNMADVPLETRCERYGMWGDDDAQCFVPMEEATR